MGLNGFLKAEAKFVIPNILNSGFIIEQGMGVEVFTTPSRYTTRERKI